MSSPSYDTAVAFLVADIPDVVEAEQPGILNASVVIVSRVPRGTWPRSANPRSVSVEIVARGETPVKAVGIGYDEVSQVFDLMCCVRKTTPSTGAPALDIAEDLARALFRRYRLTSGLEMTMIAPEQAFGVAFPRPAFTVPYFGSEVAVTRFVRSDAKRIEIDADPEAPNRVRAVTRVTFTFLVPRADA